MSVPKWNDERTERLVELAGEGLVSQETITEAAEELETSARSVSSKLRKMGYEVELASEGKNKTFSEEEANNLANFLDENSGAYTYSEVAENFAGGKFSPRQVQGKILSMERTDDVKATPKVESKKTYTDEEESKFVEMANDGAFLEDIAEALDKPLSSVRGKALSLLREESISGIPKQKNSVAETKEDPFEALKNVEELTVEEIADKIGKTPRGVRTMLTRRGVNCADYKGADKKAKNAAE